MYLIDLVLILLLFALLIAVGYVLGPWIALGLLFVIMVYEIYSN